MNEAEKNGRKKHTRISRWKKKKNALWMQKSIDVEPVEIIRGAIASHRMVFIQLCCSSHNFNQLHWTIYSYGRSNCSNRCIKNSVDPVIEYKRTNERMTAFRRRMDPLCLHIIWMFFFCFQTWWANAYGICPTYMKMNAILCSIFTHIYITHTHTHTYVTIPE